MTSEENVVVIDTHSRKKLINPMIYSNFIEHLGDCIHNGIWTYDPVNVPLVQNNPFLIGVRQDLLNAVRELNPTVIRAFGGCYSDVYHWKDAIGPRENRKKVKNLHWGAGDFESIEGLGPIIENQFGTDEFLTFCEAVGAKAYLNVNYGSGTPEEAADWVEYCNGSINTKYGALRAKHGRKEPYNVKIWGIANEIYASWEKGYEKSPVDYAQKYLKFAMKMREKDPSIKLVAVGWDNSDWNQTFLKNVEEKWMDYLSVHRYLPSFSGTSAGKKRRDNEKTYHAIMASPFMLEELVMQTWKDIVAVFSKDTHLRIAFDEWGLWYLLMDVIRTNYNLQDGIWTALVLILFQKMSDACPLTNWAQLINCIGVIQTDPDGIILTPVYLAFKMLKDHMESKLIEDVKVNCVKFENKPFKSIPERKNVPYIECNATINDSGDKLSILLVNKHFSDKLAINLKLKGCEPGKSGKIVELTSESAFDYNTIENRKKIQIRTREITGVDTEMSLGLAPHSITILKIKKE